MEINLPPEIEARLAEMAAQRKRSAEQLAVEMLQAQLAYDAWFIAEVEKGRSSLIAGRYVSHEDVVRRCAESLGVDADSLV